MDEYPGKGDVRDGASRHRASIADLLRSMKFVAFLCACLVLSASVFAQGVERVLTLPDDRPMPVSVVLRGQTALVADYLDLWNVDLRTGAARKLSPEFPDGIRRIWQPTGVYEHGGRIYVANYVGHNILIGSSEGDRFVIDQVLSGRYFDSPENVFANDDGIAVADYDSSKVVFFGPDGKFRWEAPVLGAHGVAIYGNHVFVSSLTGDGVVKLEIADGSVDRRSAATNWHRATHIGVSGPGWPGPLFVVDANARQILFIDEDLNVVAVLTPSGTALPQRPYGAAAGDGRMLMTDTENQRLIWVHQDGSTEIAIAFANRTAIGTELPVPVAGSCTTRAVVLGSLLPQDLRADASFGALCLSRDGAADGLLMLPSRSSLSNRPAQPFGFVWTFHVDLAGQQTDVLGAANRSVYMVASGDDFTFVRSPRPTTSILGPVGAEGLLNDIAARGLRQIGSLREATKRCGAIAAFLRDGGASGPFAQALLGALKMPLATTLARKWLAGEAVTAGDIDMLTAQRPLWLDDLAIVRRLPSARADIESISYDGCSIQ
jgi:hypothetical protein